MWNPQQYVKFNRHRSRPFFDLVAQISLDSPELIVDLGCGTGHLTATLAERWPEASILGIDSSPEMIEVAAVHKLEGRLDFVLGDLSRWEAPGPVDLIVANASLHWVPDHRTLLTRLMGHLSEGGCLAFQVPNNFREPSHLLIKKTCASEAWVTKLGAFAEKPVPVETPAEYIGLLTELGAEVEAWETIYQQVLQGPNPVLEWTKGTALRPILAILDEEEKTQFLSDYGALLSEAYPSRNYGTLFPFHRLFFVCEKRSFTT